jgi:hypothetical protein
MNEAFLLITFIVNAVVIGIGATLIMDLYAFLQHRFLAIAPLNYALVGRWLMYMPKGYFHHESILVTKPVGMESVVGWAAHYGIGIVFSAILIIVNGNSWLIEPTLMPSIAFGILTVIFPFFLMQPCFGFGFTAAKTPKPNVARLRSLVTHAVFGFGLYLSALLNSYFSHQA